MLLDMETKKRPFQRHFAYMHPTFGTKNRPKPESAWKKSVYYWWWAYLKRNEEYIACCANGGSGKMAALYADFGDVRGESFKEWWSTDLRGLRLFAEPRAEDSFRVLETGEVVAGDAETLAISFPLNLPKKFIEKSLKQLLAKHHTGVRGKQHAKNSKAKYQFIGQPNLKALEVTMKIYDYRMANPDMTLWEVGNSSPLIDKKLKLENDDSPSTAQDKKFTLASTVSRYLKKYKEYVEATGRGCFLSAKKASV